MSLPDSHPRRNLGGQASTTVLHTATNMNSAASSTSTDSTLTPGSSPPLIVAFLAIGLFMAAMIAIFGWRRMTYGRGIIVRVGSPGVDPQKATAYFGEKPRLWDLETQRTVENNGRLWQYMLPLSASIKRPLGEAISPPDSTSAQVAGTTTTRIPPHLEDIGRHFRRPTRVRKSADPEVAEGHTLQIAMAIAMPSSRKREREGTHEGPEHTSNHTHELFDGDNRMEYSLGLMDIPWHAAER